MKKILSLLLVVLGVFVLSGCGKSGDQDVLGKFSKSVENSKGYNLTGELEIINNEDTYKYKVNVSFMDKDYFRVSLTNKANNHEQIILKNNEGVYVLTPSLNKSFKFQSDWPYNSSQSYLLQTLVNDLKADNSKTFEETVDGYLFTTKSNHPNNPSLVKQKVYLSKDHQVTKVEVLDNNDVVQMRMTFEQIDMKATFNDSHFALSKNMETASLENTTVPVTSIENVIYPMYMPTNTSLASQDVLAKEDGERVILTFSGDNPFLLVEETASYEQEMTVIPMTGDPLLLVDTVAAISDTSITWISGGIEYYLVSSAIDIDELISIARSLSTIPVNK